MSTITIEELSKIEYDKKQIQKRTILENLKIKIYQNRFLIFGTISAIGQIWFVKNAYIIGPEILQESKKVYEEIAFVSTIELAEPQTANQEEAQGEIKETEKLDTQVKEDPRISSAQNVFMIGATLPIDLTPDIKPEYPMEARKNGIEGVVTLEIVIADTGEVLRAIPINKPLGFGLEQAAIAAFLKKKYQPAIYEGKPITVKVMVPVQFRLN